MTRVLKKVALFYLLAVSMLSVPVAFAASGDCQGLQQEFNQAGAAAHPETNVLDIFSPFTYCNSQELVSKIITLVLSISGGIAVIFLMIGGFSYMFSQGNETKAEHGKKVIQYALMGLGAVLLAFAIVRIVTSVVVQNKVL